MLSLSINQVFSNKQKFPKMKKQVFVDSRLLLLTDTRGKQGVHGIPKISFT